MTIGTFYTRLAGYYNTQCRKIKPLAVCIALSHQLMAQSYQQIHQKAIFIDTHNDFLTKACYYGISFDTDLKGKTHSDLSRLQEGGIDLQFFSVWSDGKEPQPFNLANRQMDSLDAVLKRNPEKIIKISNSKALNKAIQQKKITAMFGIEGGHFIENDLAKLDSLYTRGARYMTLTWNNSTAWASSAYEETFKKDLAQKGLSDFGKQVVAHMNKIGMLVDVSHVGETTFWDVINTSSLPIIASHSSVFNICPHQRNLKDEQIKAIAKNGGVIQVNFNSGFIDSNFSKKETAFMAAHQAELDSLIKAGKNEYMAEEYIYKKYHTEAQLLRPSFDLLIYHIEYIIQLVGVDYVGIGSDFDGVVSTPLQMDDVTAYPLITKALHEKGYSKKDINKILGGNFLRVLKANEAGN